MSKEKILLHSCCATCAGYCIDKLLSLNFEPWLYFYNPNIHPEEEYLKRKDELQNYATKMGLQFTEGKYELDKWMDTTKGLENEPEKGKRCIQCFDLRLEQSALFAVQNEIKYFTTTLTISPHKNSLTILDLGQTIAEKYNLIFIEENFKKMDGFNKTMEIAKKQGFYRQNYCGCKYSFR
ncbi:MAG: epoxyqueuosine reductase QueH [Eubacteriales bacterium]